MFVVRGTRHGRQKYLCYVIRVICLLPRKVYSPYHVDKVYRIAYLAVIVRIFIVIAFVL